MASDRERGFLSKRDRRYLQGELDEEPTPARERNIRKDIRERTASAFQDFTLVMENLQEKDREMIFETGQDKEDQAILFRHPLERGLVNALAFIFVGVTEESQFLSGENMYSDGQYHGSGDYQSPKFLKLLYDGLHQGYEEFDILIKEMELRIEAGRSSDMKNIQLKLEDGETLDYRDFAIMAKRGRLDPKAFAEFIEQNEIAEREENDNESQEDRQS